MSQVTGTDTTGHEQDNTDEVQILEDQFGPTEAIGIALGSASAIDNLNEMENESRSSSPDVANNITTANELIGVLQDLNPLTALASTGNDTINGGAGNDFIFGDSVFTDTLAAAEGLTADEGSGWQVFTDLESGMGMVTAGWDRDDTINYIRDNHPGIGAESEKGGVGRAGGNDIIDAGAGNDIVYGQEGDDIIEGGSGDDYLVGGSGADTFVWRAAESGTDVVNDFSTAEGDILNIADLLVGEEALDHSTDALLAAGLDGDYISISIDANATITLFGDGTGSGTPANDQIIETGFDTTGFTDSAAVIESLLGSSNLVVD